MAGQIIARGKGVWLVRVYLGCDPLTGKRVYDNQTVHGTKKDAEGVQSKTLTARDKGEIVIGESKLTVAALLDDLLLDYKMNGKQHWWAEIIVEKNLKPFFGKMPVSKVSTAAVKKFMAKRHEEGRANATINNDLALLRRALNLGRQCTPPKVHQVPYIPKLETNNVRKGFFEHDEFLAMRAALPEHYRPILTFAYHTGCRKGEILSLRWSQVDLQERVVRLEPGTTKNDEARIIPMAPDVYTMLVMQSERRAVECPECPWVFFRGKGEQIRKIQNAWLAACETAGLWDPKAKKPTKLFHDLRRTGVRNLVRAGAPEVVAQRISGHKTRAVFDRYNIVNETDLKDATRRLGEYLASKDKEAEKKRAGEGQSESSHTIRTQGHFGGVQ
jgi:integrase